MKKTENKTNEVERLYFLHTEKFPASALISYNLGYLGTTEQLVSMFKNANGRDIYPIIQWDKGGEHIPIRSYFVYLNNGEKVIEKSFPINNHTFINYSDILRRDNITYTVGYYNKTPNNYFLLYKNEGDGLEHLFLTKNEIKQQEFQILRNVYPHEPILLYRDKSSTDLPILFVINNGKEEYEIIH